MTWLAIIIAISLFLVGLVEIKDGSCCCGEITCDICDPPIIGDVILDMTGLAWAPQGGSHDCSSTACDDLAAEFVIPPAITGSCGWLDEFIHCVGSSGNCRIQLAVSLESAGGGQVRYVASAVIDPVAGSAWSFGWTSAAFDPSECHVERSLPFNSASPIGDACCVPGVPPFIASVTVRPVNPAP